MRFKYKVILISPWLKNPETLKTTDSKGFAESLKEEIDKTLDPSLGQRIEVETVIKR